MKKLLLPATLAAALLTGCVFVRDPARPVVVSEPAPVVYSPGYTVQTLPAGYRTTTYGRRTYYVNRDVYYQRRNGGYVVVARPY